MIKTWWRTSEERRDALQVRLFLKHTIIQTTSIPLGTSSINILDLTFRKSYFIATSSSLLSILYYLLRFQLLFDLRFWGKLRTVRKINMLSIPIVISLQEKCLSVFHSFEQIFYSKYNYTESIGKSQFRFMNIPLYRGAGRWGAVLRRHQPWWMVSVSSPRCTHTSETIHFDYIIIIKAIIILGWKKGLGPHISPPWRIEPLCRIQ